jgi:prophage DNA circulation protein
MADIFDVTKGFSWRKAKLSPAVFRQARFHCEMNAIESGRRIVEHEFPKKDLPYAEDMGRAHYEFTVRGYCIVFPYDLDPDGPYGLYMRDYTLPRDRLKAALEQQGPGDLQLPTQPIQQVVCVRYRLTEEEKLGGYCVFDMTFMEYGIDPLDPAGIVDTATTLEQSVQRMQQQILRSLQPPNPSIATGLPNVTTSV